MADPQPDNRTPAQKRKDTIRRKTLEKQAVSQKKLEQKAATSEQQGQTFVSCCHLMHSQVCKITDITAPEVRTTRRSTVRKFN